MRNFILSILVNWVSLLLLTYFLPNWIQVSDWKSALVAAFVLALLNALIRPILMILSMPLNLITLGLFTFVINAFMLYIAQYLVSGFTLQNDLFVIFILAVIMSVLNSILMSILKGRNN